MNTTLAAAACCPVCGTDLVWASTDAKCLRGHVFEIRRGIPRLLPSVGSAPPTRTAERFGYQWQRFRVADPAEDAPVFEAKTGLSLRALAGRLALDAGCGSGRYARLAGEAGADVLAMDLSDAVATARAATAHLPNVAVLQGDLLNPPFKPGIFDVVYSIGVLHHTPSTEQAFRSVARLVKPGGYLAVWLYRRNTVVQEAINSGLRGITTRLPIPALAVLARAAAVVGGVPLVRHLNKVVGFSAHPRWETRVCDTFDWYAPPYQFHHTEAELLSWFETAGYDRLRVLNSQPRKGSIYDWAYRRNLIMGSGVNVAGVRRADSVTAEGGAAAEGVGSTGARC